jgi:UDP-N-acetylmuramoyl-tripeptide--D-alanyl-D-alanine ligase
MRHNVIFRYRRAKIRFISTKLDYYVRKVIEQKKVKVVTVTGTIGKTSAKVAISQLLSTKYRLFIEDQNHNSDRAIRLNFFGLEFPDHSRRLIKWVPVLIKVRTLSNNFPFDMVILEMAESRHASLSKFIAEIEPDIGVVTGVSPVHLRYFKTLDRIVAATWGLVNLTKLIVYNEDFNELKKLATNKSNTVGYGLNSGFARIEKITRNNQNTLDCNLVIGKDKKLIKTNFIAAQSLYGLLAAVTVANQFDWGIGEIAKNIQTITPIPGRMTPIEGIKNSLLIDDSFNASPISVSAALDALDDMKGHKIAVLGSMNELGIDSAKEHAKIGKKAARVADVLVTVGSEAKEHLVPAAIKEGLDKDTSFALS